MPDFKDLQGSLDHYWSLRASAYNDFQQHAKRSCLDKQVWSQLLSDALGSVTQPGPVLDVGTGSGYIALLLAQAGYQVLGVDPAAGMLAEAKKQAAINQLPVHFSRQYAQQLGLATNSVSAVVNRYLLWTLSNPVAALKEWVRVLKPGGMLLAIDAIWFPAGSSHDLAVPSKQGTLNFADTYTPDAFAQLPLAQATSLQDYLTVFHAAGLEDVEVRELTEIGLNDKNRCKWV